MLHFSTHSFPYPLFPPRGIPHGRSVVCSGCVSICPLCWRAAGALQACYCRSAIVPRIPNPRTCLQKAVVRSAHTAAPVSTPTENMSYGALKSPWGNRGLSNRTVSSHLHASDPQAQAKTPATRVASALFRFARLRHACLVRNLDALVPTASCSPGGLPLWPVGAP